MPDAPAPERRKHALLAGVNAYPNLSSFSQLDGCVNDARVMAALLRDTFGFDEENVTLLTDEGATRDGLLHALDALAGRVEKDDVVVFFFAGHGSQMTDREGDEPDGLDETIVPHDAARAPLPNRDITDDEIHEWIVRVTDKTPFVTLIFDCCHSGTLSRDAFGAKARSLAPDTRPASELPPSPVAAVTTRSAGREEGPSGWLPLGEKYVLIAGCRDEELSYEYRDPETQTPHGALTYFLSRRLAEATPGTTYRDVFESLRAPVTAHSSKQHPQMEGALDREIFGVRDIAPARFLPVESRDGATVELGGGAAHGLTAGSVWSLHPAGTKRPGDAQRLGKVEITRVGALTSEARIVEEQASDAVGAGTRAFEETHAPGTLALRVAFDPPGDHPAEAQAFLNALDASGLLTHTTEAEAADFRAYVLPARDFADAPVPQAGPLREATWAVVGQDGRLAMPLHTLREVGVVERLRSNLEALARYRHALTLDNPASALRGKVDVRLHRQKNDGTWAEAAPEAGSGEVVFTAGERLALTVTNHHAADLYVYALDFGLTGRIGLLTIAGANEALQPGGTQEVGMRSALVLQMPKDFPFVEQPGEASPAEGLETLRVFATTAPTDFAALMQEGVRSDAAPPGSSLGRLLKQTFAGPTRDLAFEEPPEADADWTVVTRPFTLRQKPDSV